MEAKFSPLKLHHFTVFSCNIDSISTEDPEEIDLSSLPLEIDFDIFIPEVDDEHLRMVEVRIDVNQKEKKPGYVISVVASGIFSIDNEEDLDKRTKSNLLGISTINIMISNIRGFLKNITSYGPYSAYLMPSVDMNYLLNEKSKRNNSENIKDE